MRGPKPTLNIYLSVFLFFLIALVSFVFFTQPVVALDFNDAKNFFSAVAGDVGNFWNPGPKTEEGKTQEAREQNLQAAEPEYAQGEVLVKFKNPLPRTRAQSESRTGISSVDEKIQEFSPKQVTSALPNVQDSKPSSWYKIEIDGGEKVMAESMPDTSRLAAPAEQKTHDPEVKRMIQKLKEDQNVEYAEPNYIVRTQLVPNDFYYSRFGSWGQAFDDLWGLKKINAERAWDKTTGNGTIYVAVIDTGVEGTHQDLSVNMWHNTRDPSGNSIDDDHNGYVDDYNGWDFTLNTPTPSDVHGHGTHVAGIIAAAGNNSLGIPGLAWNVKIMPIKVLDSSGAGNIDDVGKAIQYAVDMGANVINLSLGGRYTSQYLNEALKAAHESNVVVVVAAGNSNGDALDFSPANSQYVITVGASDRLDGKASFSNYGEKIDVIAPGVDILSTRYSDFYSCPVIVASNYCVLRGTSMAAPHVSAVAALLLSLDPALTNEDVRQIIRTLSADLGPSGKDRDSGFGRLNLSSFAVFSVLTPVITTPASGSTLSGAITINGYIKGQALARYTVEIGEGRSPETWLEVANSTVRPSEETVLASIEKSLVKQKQPYAIRLTAEDTEGKKYEYEVYDVVLDNYSAYIKTPAHLVGNGLVTIEGEAENKDATQAVVYTLDWALGENPSEDQFQSTGITVHNGGVRPVSDGPLGTWNTAQFTDGQQYTLRLSVSSPGFSTIKVVKKVVFDKDLLPGWPRVISHFLGGQDLVLANLDEDRESEVLFSSQAIYAFNRDGSAVAGFPLQIPEGRVLYNGKNFTAADLDGDGKSEIILLVNSIDESTSPGFRQIYVFNSRGELLQGWPTEQFNLNYPYVDFKPLVVDLNRDNKKEVVFADVVNSQYRLRARDITGSEVSGYPKGIPGTLFNDSLYPALAAYDLDSDGSPEIAAAIINKMFLFDSLGTILPGWPYTTARTFQVGSETKPEVFMNTPSFGDIDGNGTREVFGLGTADLSGGMPGYVYGWNKEGQVLPGWPKETGRAWSYSTQKYAVMSSELDADGKDEIISAIGHVSLYKTEGLYKEARNYSAEGASALADIAGDKKPEIVINRAQNVTALDSDLSFVWKSKDFNPFVTGGSIAAEDINHNGKVEIAGVRLNNPGPAQFLGNMFLREEMLVYLWEVPTSENKDKPGWPMFGHDPSKSGRLLSTEPEISPSPIPSIGKIVIDALLRITQRTQL